MKKTLLLLLCLFLGNLTMLQVAAQEATKNRAYYENLGAAVPYANPKDATGEDPLYGGGHGLVIRASVSPTWTSTSLAGSGLADDSMKTVFGLSTPYRAIFKDDRCNSTGYFTHDAPTRVYLGGFKPIGEGGVQEDVYFTVLRTGTANGTPDEDWQGRGTAHLDLKPNGTTGTHNGDLIGGYVVVGKGLTPNQLINVRTKVEQEENGNLPTYETYEDSYLSGLYASPTFCSETAVENAASYVNVPGGTQTITIPSFIMLDQEFADNENELVTYKGRHLILKVVGIDFGAFSDVEHTHFILPKGITYIGDSGLRKTGFSAPKKISFHKGSNVYPFIGETCTDEEWDTYNNIEALGHYAMSYAKYDSIHQVVNKSKLREFGDRCFQGWETITSLNLSKTPLVTKVARGAFALCPNLAEVKIGPSIQEIGPSAFSECSSLTSLTFDAQGGDPAGADMALTTIGDNAFENTRLTTFIPPVSLKNVGSYAFYGCRLGNGGRFDLPKHIENIGEYALAHNRISYVPFIAGTDEAPENPVGANGLTLGYRAFYEIDNDLTVEFNAITPPKIIADDGRPFDTDDTHRVRIIVPLSSGECYKHAMDRNQNKLRLGNLFSEHYHHHEYRVKFDLRKNYEKPNYGHYTSKDGGTFTYSKAPWWVASTSWTLDNYVLKPSHGGTVDTWASTTTTNNMGESKTLWTPTIDFYIDPADSTVHGEQHVFPRTAHQYFDNEKHDDVPKISTQEVEDAILPPDEGMLFAYTQPAIYLMPLYADYGDVAQVIKTVPQKYGVEIDNTVVNDPPLSLDRVKIHSKLLTFDSDSNLVEMAGKPWLDFNDHTAQWRQFAVWKETSPGVWDYDLVAIDRLSLRDSLGNVYNESDFEETVTIPKGKYKKYEHTSDGQIVLRTGKYEFNSDITLKKYDYWTSSSGRPYRCAAGYNKFIIPSKMSRKDWAEASEMGAAELRRKIGDPVGIVWITANYGKMDDASYIKSDSTHKVLFYRYVPCTHKFVATSDTTIKNPAYTRSGTSYSEGAVYSKTFHAGDTIYCGNMANKLFEGGNYNTSWGYGKRNIKDWHCRQWIDIFDLIQEWGMGPGEVQARHDFHDNHTDNGNILVPCVEPTYVWPFWETVTQETYLSDSASNPLKVSVARKYFQQDSGEWDYTPYYVSGRPSVVMNGDEYADGFISFGLSNGYFVQTQNPGYTRANRAYFRVHSSVLMKDLYNPTVSPTNRMVIVDEDHMGSGLGEISTGLNGVKASPVRDVWYTIEGRKLNNQPTQRGVYINNGRKVVIK